METLVRMVQEAAAAAATAVVVVVSIETNAKVAMEATNVMTGKFYHFFLSRMFTFERGKFNFSSRILRPGTETIIGEEMTEEDIIINKIIQDHHLLQFMVRYFFFPILTRILFG